MPTTARIPASLPPALLVATHNTGKLGEWRALLAPLDVDLLTPGDFDLPEPEETEATYLGNARLKARAAASASGLPALADDTGFEAAALAGEPGVYTAGWARAHGGYPAALHEMVGLAGVGTPGRLVCAVALAVHGDVFTAECAISGTLREPVEGVPGFAAVLDIGRAWLEDGVLAHRRAAFARLTSR
jgi:XTP/dITP diphosphohydrolase